jgi:hypothetical protein
VDRCPVERPAAHPLVSRPLPRFAEKFVNQQHVTGDDAGTHGEDDEHGDTSSGDHLLGGVPATFIAPDCG